jgi:hypothetical protein
VNLGTLLVAAVAFLVGKQVGEDRVEDAEDLQDYLDELAEDPPPLELVAPE